MSNAIMKKVTFIGHGHDKTRLLKKLAEMGCIEVVVSENLEQTSNKCNIILKEEIQSKLLKIDFALSYFQTVAKDLKRKKLQTFEVKIKKENRLVSVADFENIIDDEFELFDVIDKLAEINDKVIENNAQIARNEQLLGQLLPYEKLEIKFSDVRESKNTTSILGTYPVKNFDKYKELINSELFEDVIVENIDNQPLSVLYVTALKEKFGQALTALSNIEFSRCPFFMNTTARTAIEMTKSENQRLIDDTNSHLSDVAVYINKINDLKLLYDFYFIEHQKAEISEIIARTKRCFVLEGWLPQIKESDFVKIIEDKLPTISMFLRDPLEDEHPPTMTVNDKFSDSFSSITNMFGVPGYRERDPNRFVAIFYFLFFGIMISDAGYGLIMAIACFGAFKLMKPVKNGGKMMLMFGFCGISTLIWGALFGGWFGIDAEVLQNSGFGRFLLMFKWFNPLEEPLIMFGLALALGVIQIGTGFFLSGLDKLKTSPLEGVMNDFMWVGVFFSFAFALIGISLKNTVITTIGWYLTGICYVTMLIGGTVGKKGVMKKLAGAFKNAYATINIFSDILSYSRIFGLGLTTGVIGMVVNKMADIISNTILGGGVFGFVVSVFILIGGHSFNLAINLLGAYVHNSRLQYIEFFSRFYQGSGKEYTPFGHKTKYNYLDN